MTVYEANVDLLNGISYDKGCYLGQETVARGYHKGQIRKRCMPAVIFPEDWEGEIEDGETELSVASKVRSCEERHDEPGMLSFCSATTTATQF